MGIGRLGVGVGGGGAGVFKSHKGYIGIDCIQMVSLVE